MPVVPSFGSYAPKPDMAGAYLGGQRIALGREQLAQEAQQASARFAMEGQRLQEQRQIAEMELSAKMATQQQEQMRRQQEMEIEKSYRQTQIGLEERRLQQAAQLMDMKLKEAAQSFAAQQTYQTEMAGAKTPQDQMRVLMQRGPSVGASIPAAAFPRPDESGLPTPVEYTSPETGKAYYRGEKEGAWRIQSQEYDVEGRMMRDESRTGIQKKIDTLQKANLSDEGRGISEDSKPTSDSSKAAVAAYIRRKAEIKALEVELRGMRSSARSDATLPPGMASKTNQVGRFKIISK